jgi:hypothetical protein
VLSFYFGNYRELANAVFAFAGLEHQQQLVMHPNRLIDLLVDLPPAMHIVRRFSAASRSLLISCHPSRLRFGDAGDLLSLRAAKMWVPIQAWVGFLVEESAVVLDGGSTGL